METLSHQQTVSLTPPPKMILIKKDSMWKPIFRRFRKYIKEIVSRQIDTIMIEDQTASQRGKIYGKILRVPDNLLNQIQHRFSLVLMIESRRMTQKRNLLTCF